MLVGGQGMEHRSLNGVNRVSDETLGCIFAHLDSPADRRAVSQVCRQWKRVDSNTRKHVQIDNCYSITPAFLSRRFPNLHSLKIKGKPRAFEFGVLAPNWGGYAKPWVEEVAMAYVQKFQVLWLLRMHVTDTDLQLIGNSCSTSLLTLKLEKCLGFSTTGLNYITTCCRSLKVLDFEECDVLKSSNGGGWLHQLARHNQILEELNFQYTTGDGLDKVDVADLEILVENCKSLRSLKVNDTIDIMDMGGVLSRAPTLLELGPGRCSADQQATTFNFPRSTVSLSGLYELSDLSLPMISSMLANLKRLELQYSDLSQEGHCDILRHCHQLEELKVRNGLGDVGLRTVAETCKKLRRIRIDDNEGEGFLSPAGIIPLAQNCVKLEFLVMYVSNLNNAALAAIAENCTVMKDCRFVLLSTLTVIPDLPLDEGVKSLLHGCRNLTRFALYVRPGALTDRGMAYIGQYGGKLKWILLGCAGESDLGLSSLACGCQSLERLEMRACPVTEIGLSAAALTLKNSLKYMWVQGYQAAEGGGALLARSRPFWAVETYHGSEHVVGQISGYCCLAGPRTDNPPEISVIYLDGAGQHMYQNGGP